MIRVDIMYFRLHQHYPTDAFESASHYYKPRRPTCRRFPRRVASVQRPLTIQLGTSGRSESSDIRSRLSEASYLSALANRREGGPQPGSNKFLFLESELMK